MDFGATDSGATDSGTADSGVIASAGPFDSAGKEVSGGNDVAGAVTSRALAGEATLVRGPGTHCTYAKPATTMTPAPARYFHPRFRGATRSPRPLNASSLSHSRSLSERDGNASVILGAARFSVERGRAGLRAWPHRLQNL